MERGARRPVRAPDELYPKDRLLWWGMRRPEPCACHHIDSATESMSADDYEALNYLDTNNETASENGTRGGRKRGARKQAEVGDARCRKRMPSALRHAYSWRANVADSGRREYRGRRGMVH